jgi:hypothetical protein
MQRMEKFSVSVRHSAYAPEITVQGLQSKRCEYSAIDASKVATLIAMWNFLVTVSTAVQPDGAARINLSASYLPEITDSLHRKLSPE